MASQDKKSPLDYSKSGVDLDMAEEISALIAKLAVHTYQPRVIRRAGGFAGMLRLDFREPLFRRDYRRPVLVGCADGVGTKALLAAQLDILDTIGIDLVAMNVNDLITTGAEPLFFLDCISTDKIDPRRVERLVRGMVAGCREAGCALLGGETAEMPGLYRRGLFELTGFCVGVADERRIIDGSNIEPGDVLVGLPSSGVHANGFSLVRAAIQQAGPGRLTQRVESLGCTFGQALMAPTRIYAPAIRTLLAKYKRKRVIRGMAHITGGGLRRNIARILPEDCAARIAPRRWPLPPIFSCLLDLGIARDEMYRVFNMGIGYALAVRPRFAAAVVRHLKRAGETAFVIGEILPGRRAVELVGV